MAEDLNGDQLLGPGNRLRYLWRNLWRNTRRQFGPAPKPCRWNAAAFTRRRDKVGTATPFRFNGEAFLRYELPAQKASARAVKVLDVGCGTGRTAAILADAGYHGEYVGVDVRSRFDPPSRASESFTLQFVEGDALTAEVGEGFDLILSNSALEHICDDARLAERLRGLLAPDGLQVHVVPAPAALFVYLWHGFRQYAPRDIADRFGHASRIFALGGLASFLFHLSWVTVPEILMSLSPRRRFPKLYARMLALSLSLDRALGVAATGYVVLAGPGSGVRPC